MASLTDPKRLALAEDTLHKLDNPADVYLISGWRRRAAAK